MNHQMIDEPMICLFPGIAAGHLNFEARLPRPSIGDPVPASFRRIAVGHPGKRCYIGAMGRVVCMDEGVMQRGGEPGSLIWKKYRAVVLSLLAWVRVLSFSRSSPDSGGHHRSVEKVMN